MSDEREILTQAEIDALLSEVEAAASGADFEPLEADESEAIKQVLAVIAETIAQALSTTIDLAAGQLTIHTAGDTAKQFGEHPVQVRFPLPDQHPQTPVILLDSTYWQTAEAAVAQVGPTLAAMLSYVIADLTAEQVIVQQHERHALLGAVEAPWVQVKWPFAASHRLQLFVPLAAIRQILSLIAGSDTADTDVAQTAADAAASATSDVAAQAADRQTNEQADQSAASASEAVSTNVDYPELSPGQIGISKATMDLLYDVPLEITVVLGRTRRKVAEVLQLASGSILELDKLAGEAVEVLVNGQLIARGEVVVIDEYFGVRVTDIVSRAERLQKLQ